MRSTNSPGTCAYCGASVLTDAVKCAACGEWMRGRWRVSDAGKVCLALICVVAMAMVALATTWVPSVRSILAEFGGQPTVLAQIAVTRAWLMAWMVGMVGMLGLVAVSFLLVTRSRTNHAHGGGAVSRLGSDR